MKQEKKIDFPLKPSHPAVAFLFGLSAAASLGGSVQQSV